MCARGCAGGAEPWWRISRPSTGARGVWPSWTTTWVCRTAIAAWCPWRSRAPMKARTGAAPRAISFGSLDAPLPDGAQKGSKRFHFWRCRRRACNVGLRARLFSTSTHFRRVETEGRSAGDSFISERISVGAHSTDLCRSTQLRGIPPAPSPEAVASDGTVQRWMLTTPRTERRTPP